MGAGTTEDAGGVRSDTVMLVNIPASRKRVVAVSFPRDLAITPMLCDAWDPETGKYGPLYDADTQARAGPESTPKPSSTRRIAFGGPKCLVKVIQKLSGLAINRFIAVDFAGFAKMVDAVGGVKVCSTTPLQDYELGTVLPQAGWQTLDGRAALQYVRARQVTTEINGDYGRIKRQQLFLSSLLRSMISTDVFFSLSKLNDVVNTFIDDSTVDNVKTKDLVDLGQSIQGMSAGRVTFLTVPTGQTDSEGNEPLRSEDNRALFDAIINDDPLPGENSQNETTTPATAARTPQASSTAPTSGAPAATDELVNAVTAAPQTITVHVSNSTGQDGLGASATSGLQQHGFKVLTPDDYPRSLPSTTVLFSSGNEQAAATVASAFPNPSNPAGDGDGRRRAGGSRTGLQHRQRAAAHRLAGTGTPHPQRQHPADRACRRTSALPTPPILAASKHNRRDGYGNPAFTASSPRTSCRFMPHADRERTVGICEPRTTSSSLTSTAQLGEMCGQAGVAMERATQALLQADLVLAEQVITDHEQISAMSVRKPKRPRSSCLPCRHRSPATCGRLSSSIQIVADIDRMGRARAARRQDRSPTTSPACAARGSQRLLRRNGQSRSRIG